MPTPVDGGRLDGGRLTAPWRQRVRSIEAAAAAGIVAAVGWVIALTDLLDAPDVDASDSEILAYYADPPGLSAMVSLQILVFATMGFLWFMAVVRNRIGEAEPKLFGTVFFGGGILFAALMFVGSAALAAPEVLGDEGERLLDADAAAMTRTFARIVLGVFAPRLGSLFVFSLSALALRTGALALWLVVVSYGVGIAMFVNVTFSTPNMYLFPFWIALVSFVLLIRGRQTDLTLERAATEANDATEAPD